MPDFFTKFEKNPFADLYWNVPETKQGSINVIGGAAQNFRTPVKVAETLASNWPVKNINTVLPESLAKILPATDNIIFAPATETGSFADGASLIEIANSVDFNILIGDLSKNNVTAKAISEFVLGGMTDTSRHAADSNSSKPILLTRDSVDLVVDHGEKMEQILMRENLIWLLALPQLIKLIRGVYYPKMITLSQPLTQIAEVLHKFTLSYPCKIVTLINGQLAVAENGKVHVVPLEKTGLTILTLWNGDLAAKIAVLNLYNPNNFLSATTAALFPTEQV